MPVGAQERGADRPFGSRADVLQVEIPVHVVRDGDPVRGLDAEDFRVVEGKKELPIVGFEVVDLAEVEESVETAVGPGVPVAARRHFLLLFDLSFSNPGSVVKARAAAHDFVAEGLHATDFVAVATYAETRGADLVLGFTSDRLQLGAAIDSLGLLDPVARKGDPLKLVIQPGLEDLIGQGGGATFGPAGGEGANRDGIFLEIIRDLSGFAARNERTQQINQILNLSGSLEELAGYLAATSGRKHVVYLSEGFDSSVMLGTEDQERVREMTLDAQFGEVHRVDSDERFGNSQAQDGVFDMLERFRRCDCAIQAVDIAGLRAGTVAGGTAQDRSAGQDGLFIMADQTGGEFYRNYNDLSVAMGEMLERTSVTYLLSVAPEGLAFDGSYHPIEVRLKGAGKGARVSHRPGYYAPRSYADLSPEERQFATAERVLGGEVGGEIPVSVLAVPFRGEGGRAYVSTWVEVDGFALRQDHAGDRLPVEIFAYAISASGTATDYFSEGVLLDLPRVGSALDARGFKFAGHFELGAGRYEIRALARNAVTGASGLAAATVVVPDFAAGAPIVSPPLFIEPQGLWLMGKESSQQGREVREPLKTSSGRNLAPAAAPILPAGQAVPLMLLAHGFDSEEPELSARFVPAEGGEPLDASVSLGGQGTLGGAQRLAATLLLGSISPGDYTLEVVATGAGGSSPAVGTIPVVVY